MVIPDKTEGRNRPAPPTSLPSRFAHSVRSSLARVGPSALPRADRTTTRLHRHGRMIFVRNDGNDPIPVGTFKKTTRREGV